MAAPRGRTRTGQGRNAGRFRRAGWNGECRARRCRCPRRAAKAEEAATDSVERAVAAGYIRIWQPAAVAATGATAVATTAATSGHGRTRRVGAELLHLVRDDAASFRDGP